MDGISNGYMLITIHELHHGFSLPLICGVSRICVSLYLDLKIFLCLYSVIFAILENFL